MPTACLAALGCRTSFPRWLRGGMRACAKAASKHAYTGVWSGLRAIYREGGMRGLYQGLDAVMVRLFVGSAAQMAGYDAAKQWGLNQGVLQRAGACTLCRSDQCVWCCAPCACALGG